MNFETLDWEHIITSAAFAVAIIATIKTDIRWLKQWMVRHEAEDTARFTALNSRVDKMHDGQ